MINPLMHYPGRCIPRPATAPSVHNSVPTPTPHPTPDPEAVSQPEEDVHMDSESDDPLDLISEDSFLLDTDVLAGLVDAVNGAEPYQWRDIKGRPDAHLWEQAAMEEFNSLVENGTFQPVRLPPGRKAIGCRWVFKLKRKADDLVDRYKARLVAKGYSQCPGVEFS